MCDLAAVRDRQAMRRLAGIPTVSLLVGPIGAGVRTWCRWATEKGHKVVVSNRDKFPHADWIRSIAEQVDLPAVAVRDLARRAARDPEQLLAAWRVKTLADCDLFWNTLAPTEDDDLLRGLASLAVGHVSSGSVATALSDLGERVVPTIVRLVPSAMLPSLLFVSGTTGDFLSIGTVAAEWAMRLPTVPIAVAVPAEVWSEYLVKAPESRTKALLKEGEISLPTIDVATVERTLAEAGARGSLIAAVVSSGAGPELMESAVAAVRATSVPPATPAEDDGARSAAERFLFEFLESLPETTGRFELNGTLDFRFGSRPAEVDILCRSPRVAIELDGYFHFVTSDRYRRDRSKDWELQRRGFIVLRFLAEDVLPQLDQIRDRILDALS